MLTSIREQINENCEGCEIQKDEADEIVPVSQGRWILGPEWYCGDCI